MRMHCLFRICLGFGGFLLSTATSFAEMKVERKPDQPTVYHLVADPAVEPDPALRIRLFDGVGERKPGNAASYYYRALLMLRGTGDQDVLKAYEAVEELGKNGTPSTNFPREQLRELMRRHQQCLVELAFATSREHCDWGLQLDELDGIQQVALPLPEFQEARSLGRLLFLKARLAISEHDYDGAFQAIRMGLRLGHDVAECPTVITGLVGVAISNVMIAPLLDIISEPGSPNLYWAVANVPRPWIDMRPALEQELNLVFKFRFLRDAELSHTPEEWKRLFNESFEVVFDSGVAARQVDLKNEWAVATLVMREYPRAKAELVQFGYKADQVEKMEVLQVIALHEARVARYLRDARLKWLSLPYPQAAPFLRALDSRPFAAKESGRISDLKESLPLFEMLTPSVGQAWLASIRLDRRLVRLQAIEALRIYAATHDRKFPASLADVRGVPIPLDPMTGEPIKYHLEGETAVLEFVAPPLNQSAGEVIRLTLRKTK